MTRRFVEGTFLMRAGPRWWAAALGAVLSVATGSAAVAGIGGAKPLPGSATAAAAVPGQAVELGVNYQLTGVACLTAITCWGVGTFFPDGEPDANDVGFLVPVVAGVPGTVSLVPGTSELLGVACYPFNLSSLCDAVGQSTGSGGALVPFDAQDPSAPTMLGDESVPSVQQLAAVACAASSMCVAVGGNGVNGVIVPIAGPSVTAGPIQEASTTTLTGVACPTNGRCMIVGSNGTNDVFIPMTNGVAATPIPVASADAFNAVACATQNSCEGVGANGLLVSISHDRPGAVTHLANIYEFDSASCDSVTGTCIAVGIGQATVVNAGGAEVVPIHNGAVGQPIAAPNGSEPYVTGDATGPSWFDGAACAPIQASISGPSAASATSGECTAVGYTLTQQSRYSNLVISAWTDTIQVS